MDAAPLDDLAAHAHDTHVVIVGGGIGGLTAALACAKIGIRVTVVEASDRLGGDLHTVEIAGVPVDVAAEGYATRDRSVRSIVEELGLTDLVVRPAPRAEWIAGLPGGTAPVPADSLRGIPENPWDESVRRIIGWRGTWRAYLDRLRPPLTIGQERSLGRLVRTRMGEVVLDRLVAPLSVGGFAIHPDEVDVELAAPGLSAALTRTGSLAGGVAQVRAAANAGGGLEGIDGGMTAVVEAFQSRLLELGARVVTGAPVRSLARTDDGRWTIDLEPDAAAPGPADPATASDAPRIDDGNGTIGPADHVVVATGAKSAHRLLSAHVPGLAPARVTALEVVTLVIASPDRDAAPVRTAVYPVPGRAGAASVTDSTARWAWAGRAAGPGRRVLKVTFGGPGADPATERLDDASAVDLAAAEAAALLDAPLRTEQVRGFHRARYEQPAPATALGHAEAAARARTAVHAVPGLAVVGAWVSGTGIAQVVPDALAEAERVRRTALWGASDERPRG